VFPPETIDVREQHRFDVFALERFLSIRIDGATPPFYVREFRGGQSNPTYLIACGTGHDARRFVLRRKPSGHLLPSAHAIDREYRVMTALRGSGVPVPATLLLCEDAGVIGTAFYVMEYINGHPMTDPRLPERSPGDRQNIYRSMIKSLARLHAIDWAGVGLSDFAKPGNYVARQIRRWTTQYRASETERIDAMERLIAWLPGHVPPDEEDAIVHGDYRPGNLLIHPAEPRVAAVLDWELSTIGHPLVDLGHHALLFRTGPEDFGAFGEREPPAGVPTEEEHLALYCEITRRTSLPNWNFYVAFAMFRFAAIFQGIRARVMAGTANDPDAPNAGARARPLAERACALLGI
jgi:aminoglycoside phosphotransferase (APT) family kinase protein